MTLTSTSNLHPSRLTGRLAALMVVVGATACTVDKNLSTVSDGDTEVSTGTTAGESTSGTTGDDTSAGDTSSSTTDDTSTTDPTSTSAGSTTGEPAAACPEHPTVDDCCCFEKSQDMYVSNVCTAEQQVLCADAVLKCMDDIDSECVTAVDEALVDCALSALAGDKAGKIRVVLSDADGWWDRQIEYYIMGDGSAYRIDDTFVDLSGKYKDTGLYDLQSPAFFTGCLTGSIAEKADCLRNAVSGAPMDLCVPAFDYDDLI